MRKYKDEQIRQIELGKEVRVPKSPDWCRTYFSLRSQHKPYFTLREKKPAVSCSRCFDGVQGTQTDINEFLMPECSGEDRPTSRWINGICRHDQMGPEEHWSSTRLSLCLINPNVTIWAWGKLTHRSHKLAVYRGLFICVICGCRAATGVRALQYVCNGSCRQAGALALSKVVKGLLPGSLTSWPDETQGPNGIQIYI